MIVGSNMNHPSRRDFLRRSSVAALALPGVAAAAAADPAPARKIRLGMIGCGRRGTWIGKLFQEHGGYEIAACADYFPDRLDTYGEAFGVPANRRFAGLSGARRLVECGAVEAVAVESPPFFHPQHAALAVAAGLHVYLAKPVAVDVPGCRSVAETGKAAAAKKLCMLVDFQARTDPFMSEAMKRVAAGAIGPVAFGEATYHGEDPFTARREGAPELAADPDNAEKRLRAWGLDRAFSGDIVVEQAVHVLDMLAWGLGRTPVDAAGTGARAARPAGTSFDNFTAVLRYGDGVGVTFSHRQIKGHDTVPSGIRLRLFGPEGVLEATYAGDTLIRGTQFYRGGRSGGLFKDGAVANIAAFHASILAGRCANETVEPSVQSNLLAVLVREAAYAGTPLRWDDLLKSATAVDGKLAGLKD